VGIDITALAWILDYIVFARDASRKLRDHARCIWGRGCIARIEKRINVPGLAAMDSDTSGWVVSS